MNRTLFVDMNEMALLRECDQALAKSATGSI